MKIENKNVKIGILAVLILSTASISLYFLSNRNPIDQSPQLGETYLFIKPAFAAVMDSTPTFLDTEAGISLYVNLSHPIDLAVARTADWSGIEDETSDYIIGSIRLPNLTAADDVHCFVHKTGWIVIYYLKGEPISKIVDWNSWGQDTRKLTENKLQTGLKQMTNTLGVVATDTRYYHFQYPNATKCMLIFRTLVGGGENSFNVTIPNDITVYERSWSHYASKTREAYGTPYYSYFKIDGNTIDSIYGDYDPVTNRGTLIVSQLFPNVSHVLSVSYEYGSWNLYGICVGLVYQEP